MIGGATSGIETVFEPLDGARWLAEIGVKGVEVSRPEHVQPTTVRVTGAPSALLFWLWNRSAPMDGEVAVDGDPAAVDRLRALLTLCTQ